MEIKVNKDVAQYQENVFFGLSLRQFVCALLAVGVAVGVYLLTKGVIGSDNAAWVCILAAAPVAVVGFFKYNGLTAEKFAWAFIKTEFLCSGVRVFRAENIYHKAILEGGKKHSKNSAKGKKGRAGQV